MDVEAKNGRDNEINKHGRIKIVNIFQIPMKAEENISMGDIFLNANRICRYEKYHGWDELYVRNYGRNY